MKSSSSRPPQNGVEKKELSQEEKKKRVNEFLKPFIAGDKDENILFDLLELHTSGINDLEKIKDLIEKHGKAVYQIDFQLLTLTEECHLDYDEVRMMIQEQLGGFYETSDSGTVDVDEDGATVDIPRNVTDQYLSDITKEERKKLAQSLQTGATEDCVRDARAVTTGYFQKMIGSGVRFPLEELMALLSERMQGFEETELIAKVDQLVPKNASEASLEETYKPEGVIDQFLKGLSDQPKKIIKLYVVLKDDADLLSQVAAQEGVSLESLIAAQKAVQRLVETSGTTEDVIKRAILERLHDASAAPPAETVQPQQPQDNIDLLVAGLSGEEVGELWNQEIYERLRKEGKDMELALIMNAEANDSLSRKLQESGLTADVVIMRLQGAGAAPDEDGTTTQEIQREAMRQVINVAPGEDVSALEATVPSNIPAALGEPVHSTPEDQVTLRRVVVADGPLNGEIDNKEFVGRLTKEAIKMAKELLLLEDISDAAAIQELERRSGKSGYSRIAAHLVIRMSSSPTAKKEICDAIRALEVSEDEVPFARKRDPKDKLTIPKFGRPPAGTAEASKPTLEQILATFTQEELDELAREYRREDEEGVDTAEITINPIRARLIKKMFDAGMNPDEQRIRVIALLTGESLTSSHAGAPFVRRRGEGYVTQGPSPWGEEIIAELIEEVAPLVDRFTTEARGLFTAVVCTEDPEDKEEVRRMIQEYAPGTSEEHFRHMSGVVAKSAARFAKLMRRAPENVRKAILLKLAGAKTLPEGQPGLSREEARRAPTILSSDKQKKILARLKMGIRRKRKPKK